MSISGRSELNCSGQCCRLHQLPFSSFSSGAKTQMVGGAPPHSHEVGPRGRRVDSGGHRDGQPKSPFKEGLTAQLLEVQ